MHNKKNCIIRVLIISVTAIIMIISSAAVIAQNETKPKARFNFDKFTVNDGKYEDFFLRVATEVPMVYVEPGKSVSFKMYIRRGDMDDILHDVEVLDVDENFEIEMTPQLSPVIRNIDSIILYTTVHAPEDIEEGIYPLRVAVKGKEFVEENYPLDLRVSVGKHSNIPGILMMLITASLLGLLIWRHTHRK